MAHGKATDDNGQTLEQSKTAAKTGMSSVGKATDWRSRMTTDGTNTNLMQRRDGQAKSTTLCAICNPCYIASRPTMSEHKITSKRGAKSISSIGKATVQRGGVAADGFGKAFMHSKTAKSKSASQASISRIGSHGKATMHHGTTPADGISKNSMLSG